MKIMFSCIHFPIWPYPSQIMKKLFCTVWVDRYERERGWGLIPTTLHPSSLVNHMVSMDMKQHWRRIEVWSVNAISYKHCWLHYCELLSKCQMGLWEWCMQDTWFQERGCMQCTWFWGILEKTNQCNGSLRHQLKGYPANIMASPMCLGSTHQIIANNVRIGK